jgi:hypothetical protein
MAAELPSS